MNPLAEGAPSLGRALRVFALAAVFVLLLVALAEPPARPSVAPTRPEHYQRITPIDAPRFENGVWIDAQSQPLEPRVEPRVELEVSP